MILLQHALDVIWMKDHVGGPGKNTHSHNIAILAHHAHIKAYRITLDFTHISQQEMAVRSRRQCTADPGGHVPGFGKQVSHLSHSLSKARKPSSYAIVECRHLSNVTASVTNCQTSK